VTSSKNSPHSPAETREPRDAAGWTRRGQDLEAQGDLTRAIEAYRQAVAHDPAAFTARVNLGVLYERRSLPEQAIAEFEAAVALRPDDAIALRGLGGILRRVGQLERAVALLTRAVTVAPGDAVARANLGLTLSATGRHDEALPQLAEAVRLAPEDANTHHARLLTMHYASQVTPAEVAAAHREFGRMLERRHPALPPVWYGRAEGRRLRLGFVSGDFRRHAVAFFLEPLLAHLARDAFEIHAFSTFALEDEITVRLRAHCDGFHDVAGASAGDIAQRVRRLRIDVLVDLAGHMAHNRLDVFAQQPAPLSLTWLGYPDTTGLTRIDLRITDAESDPPGLTESLHTERLLRLPGGFLCYGAPRPAPEVAPCPSAGGAPIRFGSFNALHKVSDQLLALWSRLLAAAPEAQLVLKNPFLSTESGRAQLRARLAAAGLPLARVELIGQVPDAASHLAVYGRIDVALDTYPYHGTTTTCDALWMGVPVVTLAGPAHVSRVGASLLTRVGLADLIAENEDAYIARALELARDLPRREALRRELRARMETGGLSDGARFARVFGEAMQRAYAERATALEAEGLRVTRDVDASTDDARGATRTPGDALPDDDARWLTLTDGLVLAAPATLDTLDGYVLEERRDTYEDERALVRTLLQTGEHALDLGSGTGLYALTLAQAAGLSGAVFACTEQPRDAARLRASAARNGLSTLRVDATFPASTSALGLRPAFVRIAPTELPDVDLDDLVHLCREGAPVVMVEVARAPDIAQAVLAALTGADAASYRLVPGLGLLYPCAYGEEPLPGLTNVFVIPARHREALHARGLLAARIDSSTPPTDLSLAELRTLTPLRDLDLEGAMQGSGSTSADSRAAYRDALLAFVWSRRPGLSPELRAAALQRALTSAVAALDDPFHLARLSTLARLATDWGRHDLAVEAAEAARAAHGSGQAHLREPFLPACARHDITAPGDRLRALLLSGLLEQEERLGAYSTWFTRDEPETLSRLERLEQLGFQSAELARRLVLVRRYRAEKA
jgi:predicted O-linked N-acetylglucosamine transferase (SPINDLY family)